MTTPMAAVEQWQLANPTPTEVQQWLDNSRWNLKSFVTPYRPVPGPIGILSTPSAAKPGTYSFKVKDHPTLSALDFSEMIPGQQPPQLTLHITNLTKVPENEISPVSADLQFADSLNWALHKWKFRAVYTAPSQGQPPDSLDNETKSKYTGDICMVWWKPDDPEPDPPTNLNWLHHRGIPIITMLGEGDAAPGNDMGRFYDYTTYCGRILNRNLIDGFFVGVDGIVGGFLIQRNH